MYHENKAQTRVLERQYGRREAIHYLKHDLEPGAAYLDEDHDRFDSAYGDSDEWVASILARLSREDYEGLIAQPARRMYARVGRPMALESMIKARLLLASEKIIDSIIDEVLGGSLTWIDRVAVISDLSTGLKGAVGGIEAIAVAPVWMSPTSYRIYITAGELLDASVGLY